MDQPEERWDAELAASLVGAKVLIGLTRCDVRGRAIGGEQMFGIVDAADEQKGILVRLGGARTGETFNLPPATSNIRAADPGTYSLRSTGEEIEDPDYTIVWTIYPPKQSLLGWLREVLPPLRRGGGPQG